MLKRRSSQNKTDKKDRSGRWTLAQANLFEQMIQRYGKNWKKIHQHMKGRSLSQIRSHAQKFFDKVGHKKVEEYERRAKLIEAFETLEKEKRLNGKETVSQNMQEMIKNDEIKEEERDGNQPPYTGEEKSITSYRSHLLQQSHQEELPIKKEHTVKIEEEDYCQPKMTQTIPTRQSHNGYLMNLIYLYPTAFSQYGVGTQNFNNGQSSYGPLFFPRR